MKVSELLEYLYSQRESAPVLVRHEDLKYACGSYSRYGNQVCLLLSPSPHEVKQVIDTLKFYPQDMEVCFSSTKLNAGLDVIITPITGVEYDGRHVMLLLNDEKLLDSQKYK